MTYISELADYIETLGYGRPTICGMFLCGEGLCGYDVTIVYRDQAPPKMDFLVLTAIGGSPSMLADASYDFPSFLLTIQDSDIMYAYNLIKRIQTEMQCTARVGNIVSIITDPPIYTRIPARNLHQYTMTMTVTMERS